MDAQTSCNQTAAPRDGHVDTVFLLFNCTVLALTLVLGLPGNLWVCWVVFRTKSLQTCSNALLVSLAVGDCLKCALDTPLLLLSLLHHHLSASVCALQQFTYALCSCVQLLTLVGISVDRFQVIAFPFQTDGRRSRVRLWMLCTWTCGLVLAVVSMTLSETLRPSHFGWYSDPFGPFVLVPVWGLSLTVIVVHYVRTFRAVRHHRNKVFHRTVQLRPPGSEQVWTWLNVPASAPPSLFGPLAPVGPPGPPPHVVGAVCPLKAGARERGKDRVEGKLVQRFGYTLLAFTLFWVPLVVLLLINLLSGQNPGTVSAAVFLFVRQFVRCNEENYSKRKTLCKIL